MPLPARALADDCRGDPPAVQRAGADLTRIELLLAGGRRLAILLVVIGGVTALVAGAFGLLIGASLLPSIAVGLYAVGSLILLAGFFVGNRGPARVKGDIGFANLASRRLRWATPEESEEALNMSAVFVTLGFILILLGTLADTRHRLF